MLAFLAANFLRINVNLSNPTSPFLSEKLQVFSGSAEDGAVPTWKEVDGVLCVNDRQRHPAEAG